MLTAATPRGSWPRPRRHADRACLRRAWRARLGRTDTLRTVRAVRRPSGPRDRTVRDPPDYGLRRCARQNLPAATRITMPPDCARCSPVRSRAAPRRDRVEHGACARSYRHVTDPLTAMHAAAAAIDRGDGARAAAYSRISARFARAGLSPWACWPTWTMAACNECRRPRLPAGSRSARAVLTAAPARPALQPPGFDLIAELKLRSPALGDLSARTVDPLRACATYAQGAPPCVRS